MVNGTWRAPEANNSSGTAVTTPENTSRTVVLGRLAGECRGAIDRHSRPNHQGRHEEDTHLSRQALERSPLAVLRSKP